MDPTAVWAAVLDEARQRLVATTVALWLEPVEPAGISENRLLCEIPESHFGWTVRRYAKLLGDLVRHVSTLDGIILRLRVDELADTGELAA